MVAVAFIALAALGVVRGASAYPESPTLVQPATYRSSDGRFELFVDPTHRYGLGAGRYRMSRDGEFLWAAEHAFTFFEARVPNSGEAVGYAYSSGLAGTGRFELALLGQDGAVRWHESIVREPPPHTCPARGWPWARGLFLDEDRSRFVVRMAPRWQSSEEESWEARSLSTGKVEGTLSLHETMEDAESAVCSWLAEPVPGTDLVLSHWSARGDRYCLSDSAGRVVWQLDQPIDYESDKDEYEHRKRAAHGGSLLGLGPGPRFALWFARSDERVELEVQRDANGAARMVERSRAPWFPPGEPELPNLTLRSLGSVRLLGSQNEPIQPCAVAFAPDGTTHVADANSVRVYEPSGILRNEVQLRWHRPFQDKPPSSLRLLPEGRWLVEYFLGGTMAFDPDGSCIQVLPTRYGEERTLDVDLWTVSSFAALLRNPRNEELVRLERDAENRWFDRVAWLTLSDEGRILIAAALDGRAFLSLHESDGRPIRTLPMPLGLGGPFPRQAWHGHTIAAAATARDLVFYDESGEALGQAAPTEERVVGLGFSPDGREVLVVDGAGTLQRYAAP